MSPSFFEKVLLQLKPYTNEIALHVMGDPLTLSNLSEYLDIAQKHNFKVMITTSGYYLKNHQNIFHSCLKQINISLNSFNKNALKMSFKEYMEGVFELCKKRVDDAVFINLRLWNLDEKNSEQNYNQQVFQELERFFDIKIETDTKTFRLAKKILLHFDSYFEWPSLKNTHFSHGFCHGLSAQIAILADGTVVPCCLDGEGIINLGSLHVNSLEEILSTKKVKDIQKGFQKGKAIEELCQKCSFKDRFNELL
jgi:radical SAM protein with 4Fe4S-binding SPASM domain